MGAVSMMDLLHEPLTVGILAATAVSLLLTRTRFATWSILSTLFAYVLSVELACFDGQVHLTEKFDGTFFVWCRAVELRAVGGLAIVSLGAPLGATVARLARAPRGALMGLAAMGPFGLGLLASSIRLQLSMRSILDEGTPPAKRLEYLGAAVEQSSWLVSIGTIASVLACGAIFVALTRHRSDSVELTTP
jgi:hypothetical protein